MSELLDKKEYLVGITIIEARNIFGKDAAGTSDPFVKVRVADQVQQSQKKYEANSALWAQSLTFSSVRMNELELETLEMIIELYDHNAIELNELIGQYSIGLSTLHRALNHEFHRTWVGLFNPDTPNVIQGQLLISAFIVGPGEKPPTHTSDENEDDDDIEDDGEDELKKIELMKRAQGALVISNPTIDTKRYQLTINIGKVESIPLPKGDVINPFISARVQGLVLTTRHFFKNQSPAFQNKLLFPVSFPVLNDKIIVRLWSKVSGFASNHFIASIPEHPAQFDFFNISTIAKSKGINNRWVNLYGPNPKDRGPRTKGRRDGSYWLGRILLSFNLQPNEFPECSSTNCNPLKEPKADHFALFVDLYQITAFNLEQEGDEMNLFIIIQQGSHKSEPIQAKKSKNSRGRFEFSGKDKQVPQINNEFPQDFAQIPDVFIHFYYNKGTEFDPTQRVGYVRLKAIEVTRNKPYPQWLDIRSPYNDLTSGQLGQIMANVQFMRNVGNLPPRQLLEKGKKHYNFFYQIISGFELANEDMEIQVQINLGEKKFETKWVKGNYPNYPVWNAISSDTVRLQSEIQFEALMRVSLVGRRPYKFGKGFDLQTIGSFQVVTTSMAREEAIKKPQFFNLVNDRGQFVGQILANFYIKCFPKLSIFEKSKKKQKDKSKSPGKTPQNEYERLGIAHSSLDESWSHLDQEEFKEKWDNMLKDEHAESFKIQLSVLGIRNLALAAQKPVIKAWLTQSPNDLTEDDIDHRDGIIKPFEPNVLTIDDGHIPNANQNSPQPTLNPTFAKNLTLGPIKLGSEPLIWPWLVIACEEEKKNKGLFGGGRGCEPTFITVPLLNYAQRSESDGKIRDATRYAKAQYLRNQVVVNHIQSMQTVEDGERLLDAFASSSEDESSSSSSDSDSEDKHNGSDPDGSMEQQIEEKKPSLKKEKKSKGKKVGFEQEDDNQGRGTRAMKSHVMQNGVRQTIVLSRATNAFAEIGGAQRMSTKDKKDLFKLWAEQRKTMLNDGIGIEDMYDQCAGDLMQEMANAANTGMPAWQQMDLNFDEDASDDGGNHHGETQAKEDHMEELRSGVHVGAIQDPTIDAKDFCQPVRIECGVDGPGMEIIIENIDVRKGHKKIENRNREQRKAELRKELAMFVKKLEDLRAAASGPLKGLELSTEVFDRKKDVLLMKKFEAEQEMAELDAQNMTEQKFWGLKGALADEDNENRFDYGREILRQADYDRNLEKKSLPYEVFPLFARDEQRTSENQQTVNVSGILRSGVLSSAKLKAKIYMRPEQEFMPTLRLPDKRRKEEDLDPSKERWEHERIILQSISKSAPFMLERDEHMAKLIQHNDTHYKIRVYLLSGQNISAMNNVIDLKSRLAGMYALCSSNPYPVLQISDGKTDVNAKMTRRVDGREFAVEGDLNPEFLRIFELDAMLPEDWKLAITIHDRQAYRGQDQLIGQTIIDLENRIHSNLAFLNKMALQLQMDDIKARKKSKNKKGDGPNKELPTQKQEEGIKSDQARMKRIEQIIEPIEYRELYHPQKVGQAQGILELFTEMMPVEQARKYQPAKIKQLKKQSYEIRLIIWGTREVPLVDGDHVDIFVKVTFDPTGWSQDQVFKQTDNHNNSTDGEGQFNYRMKFTVHMPCEFPRLKFQVYDAGFTSDEAIGAKSISLRRTLSKLDKEESVSIPKSLLALEHPQFPEQDRGILCFSLDLLTTEEAEKSPVGEAQDEPNVNPTLIRPTAGRGLGDAIAGAGIGVPEGWSFDLFGRWTYVIAFFGVMGTILSFAVVLK